MIIAVPKEIRRNERRVACTPDIVTKMISWGYAVHIEKSAGEAAGFRDTDYSEAGAQICPDAATTYFGADIILKIWAPEESEERFLYKDMSVIANFQALSRPQRITALAKTGIQGFALDLMPRISRAQSMDILSSQSNLAGYKAVVNAVTALDKAVPMMMTAAGTITPSRVLILGAGVAGLQAIATAKRLGAQVFASDVRPQVKEQVESLGARFVEVESTENFETAGGYAKETSEEYKHKQQLAVAARLSQTDIAITTALIPGKPAPRLISNEMIADMPDGSVIIDMAAESGGNVEGSKEGEAIMLHGVTIIGASNLASEVPQSASRLFANNIYNFLNPMYDPEQSKIVFNFFDELVDKTCVCKDGEVR